MKSFRTWLLLLVVFLLPIRGAMAAAMLCLPQGNARSESVMVEHHGSGAASAGHDHAQHSHDISAAQQNDDRHAVDSHDCKLCASFCSLTVLTSDPPD